MKKSLFDFLVLCIVDSILISFGYNIISWQWWLAILLVSFLGVSDWLYNLFTKNKKMNQKMKSYCPCKSCTDPHCEDCSKCDNCMIHTRCDDDILD